MKTITKAASVFTTVILCVLFSAAQQAPTTAPQSAAAVANNVQLVIEGKVINVGRSNPRHRTLRFVKRHSTISSCSGNSSG